MPIFVFTKGEREIVRHYIGDVDIFPNDEGQVIVEPESSKVAHLIQGQFDKGLTLTIVQKGYKWGSVSNGEVFCNHVEIPKGATVIVNDPKSPTTLTP